MPVNKFFMHRQLGQMGTPSWERIKGKELNFHTVYFLKKKSGKKISPFLLDYLGDNWVGFFFLLLQFYIII